MNLSWIKNEEIEGVFTEEWSFESANYTFEVNDRCGVIVCTRKDRDHERCVVNYQRVNVIELSPKGLDVTGSPLK